LVKIFTTLEFCGQLQSDSTEIHVLCTRVLYQTNSPRITNKSCCYRIVPYNHVMLLKVHKIKLGRLSRDERQRMAAAGGPKKNRVRYGRGHLKIYLSRWTAQLHLCTTAPFVHQIRNRFVVWPRTTLVKLLSLHAGVDLISITQSIRYTCLLIKHLYVVQPWSASTTVVIM
jgi:hypothetical protein